MENKSTQLKAEAIGRVIDTLDRLRVECPWDRKQTNTSLRSNTIEEVYELCQALMDDDTANIRKELGDVLLHILFYAKIAEEKGQFDVADVADSLNQKLIYRHPHVFGNVQADDASQVSENWEKLKLREKDGNRSVLSGVPQVLPALIKAYRIQEKAANVGFDWPDNQGCWDKVSEEIGELRAEVDKADKEAMEKEFGDVMFSLVNLARKLGINPENALECANRKFISRFNHIEQTAKEAGRSVDSMTLEEMDALWDDAKKRES